MARLAKLLLGCYRSGDSSDPDTYIRAVTAVFGEYPIEVVRRVCDPRAGLAAKSKWLPTIFEIKESCEDEMRPILRRMHEEKLASERRKALSGPPQPRPSYDELKAKYGPNWGLKTVEDKIKRAVELSLDDMCRQAGISRENFEAINASAEKHLRRGGVGQ